MGCGQTREHALLARSLGVTQLIVAMNKMENIEYGEERYDEVAGLIKPYLASIGFKDQDVYFLPLSAIQDENVMTKCKDERLAGWYGSESPCLVEILDQLRLPNRTYKRPMRVTISDYFQKSQGPLIGDCVAAQVESGVLIEK